MREINMESIRAIDRAVDVLQAFTIEKPSLTIEEMSQITDLPKNTVYRILYTLERRGLIQFDQTLLTYSPGLRLIEFALLKTSILDVEQEAKPFLNDLHQQTNHTVFMGVRKNEEQVFYAYKKENENYDGLKVSAVVGIHRPFLFGVLGPVLLAFLPEQTIQRILDTSDLEQRTPFTVTDKIKIRERLKKIKKDGVFTESNETKIGVTGIAAPIFDVNGQAIAAIGLTGPEIHLKDHLEELKCLVMDTAKQISLRMGYRS